jgi:hypothetical protein
MFLFQSHKNLNHKQSSLVGFVLAILSLLSSSILVYSFPLILEQLYQAGVFHLDLLLIAVWVTFFFSIQGLILFGFPLFYVQDKKSHMTGFQILVYALMWLFFLMLILMLLSAFVGGSVDPYGVESLLN